MRRTLQMQVDSPYLARPMSSRDEWEDEGDAPRSRSEEETTECGGLGRRDERDAQSEKDRGDTEPYRSPKTKL